MKDEQRVQKECQKQLFELVDELRRVITDQANEVKNRDPKVTERSLVLFSAVSKISETARVIVQMREIDAIDEMHVLMRSMLELMVNACYLQEATDEEVARYLNFDAVNNYIAMTDLYNNSGGRVKVPQELWDRVEKKANDAVQVSTLTLKSRAWSKNSLYQKATSVDKAVGDDDFAVLIANIYVTGSGYVHATAKTLDRHARWLLGSKEEHPLRLLYGNNNAIDGVALILVNLGRYFNRKFDTDREPFKRMAQLIEHVQNIANADHGLHRKREAMKDEA